MAKKYKLGLALSGGGARGIYHIGVIKALEELGIRPDIISGTSAGALTGVLYSSGLRSNSIRQIAKDSKWYHFLKPNFAITSTGLITHSYLRSLLEAHIKLNDFSALQIPCIIAVTNMNTGTLELHETGELYSIVEASCSVPVLFKPVLMHGKSYLDGGIIMNLPVSPLRQQCEQVIAVNLNPIDEWRNDKLSSARLVSLRCANIIQYHQTQRECALADHVIMSPELTKFSRFSLSEVDAMFNLGYNEAMHVLKKR